MAVITYRKDHLRVYSHVTGLDLAPYKRYIEEGATQTYVQGAPVVLTGGLIVEGANPATAVLGFAQRPGRNAAAGANLAEVVPFHDGIYFYANFLATGGAGGNNVFATADLGGSYRIAKANVHYDGGGAMWFVEDTGTTTAAKMVDLNSDIIRGHAAGADDQPERVQNGDTNARASFVVLDSVRTWK